MKCYDLVRELLTKYPALRDSDRKLIWSVWIKQGKVIGGKIALDDFMNATSTESIRRSRQKIQEEHPELCSSPFVQAAKNAKEEEKGTFIYRDSVDIS